MTVRELIARAASFRMRFFFVVLGGAVLPLALIGFWQTRSARKAGESLLRSELDSAVIQMSAFARTTWAFREGELVLLARNEAARRLLSGRPSDPPTAADSTYLANLAASVSDVIPAVTYRSADGRRRWSMTTGQNDTGEGSPTTRSSPPVPVVTVSVPVGESSNDAPAGQLTAQLRINRLLPSDTAFRLPAGAVLQVIDGVSHAALLPLSLPESLLTRPRFSFAGDNWLLARRVVPGTPLELIVTAPTRRYVQPFQDAARRGAIAVTAVALLALLLTAYLTSLLTSSLEQLADAADAIARGELDHHVDEQGTDEVRRVATAFNSMTANLRRTLGELAQRQALAAVGEYATSLSHEIRNALTAMRVDLQRAEEKTPLDIASRPLVVRALKQLTNLDATVSRSLRLARSGRVGRQRIDLRNVLGAATQSASATFVERGALLEPFSDGAAPAWVRGDAPSLEQLFLNLLLNSAHALRAGGKASVALDVHDTTARVVISDTGDGIAAHDLPRVFDPFFSTKAEGTGLGLAIARQIAAAHGGALHIESELGVGTRVEVRLPRT
jgi:signal transduction histidine kinase